MLPLLGRCLRLAPQFPPLVLNPTLHRPFLPLLTHQRHQLRFKGMVQKRKKRKGNAKPTESENAKRLRLKLKTQKELDKKRKRAEERVLARKTAFRLRPYEPRPDALPLGTALAVLRGWQAKAGIFVRSTAFRWAGETKVIAFVRVARNSAQPRQLRGILQLPFPVVSVGGTAERGGRTEGAREKEKNKKKKRMMVILDEGENVEDAQKAGMMVGRRADLDDIVKMVTEGKILPFDQLLATEKTVGWFRMHGRILGPKGLMPNDKQGTIVHNFATHGTTPPPTARKAKIKKGIEIKLQQRGNKDSFLRIVVAKFRQTDHEIEANLKALIKFIHETTSHTQIPLELSLYTSTHPSLIAGNPHLSTLTPPKLCPDRANPRSTASFIIPISGLRGVGHPKHLRPESNIRRWVANAEWAPGQGTAWMLARFKAGTRMLLKKKAVFEWHTNRTDKDRARERNLGFLRSGEEEWLGKMQKPVA